MTGFFKNSITDQRLLVTALAVVWCVRLGLWLLPFRVVRAIVARSTREANAVEYNSRNLQLQDRTPQDRKLVKRVASAVRRASYYVPSASCLTQALATQVLLARRGQISSLRIGVTKNEKGEFLAHAWVVSHGRIIIGLRKDLRNYAVLNRLEEVSL